VSSTSISGVFRKRSPPGLTRLSPAHTSRPHKPPEKCAWIYVQPIISAHENAWQKHNNHLGGSSPLTPRRHPRRHAVLPTPRRVCGGDSHLSGASQLSSLPSRQPGAGFRHIFPLSAACFWWNPLLTRLAPACFNTTHLLDNMHNTNAPSVEQPAYLGFRQLLGFLMTSWILANCQMCSSVTLCLCIYVSLCLCVCLCLCQCGCVSVCLCFSESLCLCVHVVV